jgi:putative endonuclease
MQYVYLLESVGVAGKRYVGVTSDLRRRLAEHNVGTSPYKAKFMPWRVVTYVAFSDLDKAVEFERYLKSGSGHAFANRHLW